MAAAVGIVSQQPDDGEEHDDWPAYLWPECEPAWRAFEHLCDQWRDGALPRTEILAHLNATVRDRKRRLELYEDVCVCARTATSVRAEYSRRKLAEREAEAKRSRRR